MNEAKRTKQTAHFLKWIQKYGGLWYLICTPNDEHMNPSMMRKLITKLAEASLYELIFVLLMVHRNADFMQNFLGFTLLDSLAAQWNEDKDKLIENLLANLE